MTASLKPWEHAKGGGSQEDLLAARFVESLSYDTRLYRHDIAGSIAHARMLQQVGLVNAEELAAIERGLGEIQREIEAANVTGWKGWRVELEDVHMCIEAALIEKVGDAGRKLHTGRSRNDQVALDLKLWVYDAGQTIVHDLNALLRAFGELAERDGEIVMPSFTHLQRAQPIVLGGELVAWIVAFERCRDRVSFEPSYEFPLGAGAIAGSCLPLDRVFTMEQLPQIAGPPSRSSIETTASRDIAIDFVYALSMISMWLSRWAEQWIIYMTAEFGFLKIGEAYTTGSSMMPQKRNPDMLELIRGRCGNVYGHLMALLTICKGLTVGYNRDLQEDKRQVFAAFDLVHDCLQMAAGIVRSAKFQPQRIQRDLHRGYLDATSLAEYLVTKGVPFRTAHQHVGKLVRLCDEKGHEQISDLTLQEMQAVCERIEADVAQWLGPENVVKRYQTYGNAGLTGFRTQIERWREGLREMQSEAEAESPGPQGLFGEEPAISGDDQPLIDAYHKVGRTLDDLPYTDEFERLYEQAGGDRSRNELFHRLHNLRKAGRLPRLGKAQEKPPIVNSEQEQALRELVATAVGNLSLRDRLPYTPQMDHVVAEYNARTGSQFSPYQVWRVIAKLAK